ncbi:MAG TPA: hypothetical protein VGN37_21785 [Actinocatenispora sp.]
MRRFLLCVAAGAAFAVAGCGQAAAPKVASAGGTPSAAAAGDARTAYVDGMRDWVRCLRKHGVQASDPDSKGSVEFPGDKAKLKTDPTFTAAQEACKDKLPPMPADLEDHPSLSPQQIEQRKRYARCMQQHGAPDFPDPGADGNYPDSQWDQTSAGARRATRACASIIGAPTDGTGQG